MTQVRPLISSSNPSPQPISVSVTCGTYSASTPHPLFNTKSNFFCQSPFPSLASLGASLFLPLHVRNTHVLMDQWWEVVQKRCAPQGRVCQDLGCLKWKSIPSISRRAPPWQSLYPSSQGQDPTGFPSFLSLGSLPAFHINWKIAKEHATWNETGLPVWNDNRAQRKVT